MSTGIFDELSTYGRDDEVKDKVIDRGRAKI